MTEHCQLCGSAHGHALFEGRDWLHGQFVQSSVFRCDECGLVYLWPPPGRLVESYPDEYAPHVGQSAPGDIAYSAGRQRGLRRKAKVVSQYGSAALLDIGCASGEFMAVARCLCDGPLFGMDISTKAVRRAHERHGLGVWVGDVPRLPLPDGSVGTVTLWHVLEHLPQPLPALQEIARVLRADGVLVLACPMVDSWEAKLFGRYWSGYDVPRHLFAYSRQTLPRTLRDGGFDSREALHVVWGYNSAKISSGFWLRRFSIFRRNPRLQRQLAALMGFALAVSFWLLTRTLRGGSAVAVFVAHKRS